MAFRRHAAYVFLGLSILGAVFLCFENLSKSGQPPSPGSRTTVSAAQAPAASPTRPVPRTRFQHRNWTADESASLRRNQSRSSAREVQTAFAGTASTVYFNWVNPGPVNPYVQIGGQYTGVAGKLQAFAVGPSDPKVMYAGGGTGSGNEGPATEAGVFKSVDGGGSWTATNQGLLDTSVNVLWVDASNPSVLLAGTEFGGLFRSTDAAATWTSVLSDASVSAIISVTGGIIAGTAAGFEFSSNRGLTWTLLQHTASGVRCMAVNGSDIIAGLDGGDILWKAPSDATWRTVASNPNLTVWDIAIDPVDPAVAYYARGYGGTTNAVFRTMDRGASWQNINAPTSTNGGFSQTIAVRASDRAILVSGQSMLYQSLDFGSTWKQLNCPWDSRKIFLFPASSSMVMGSDHGLHWSDDGGNTWRDLTATISANILFSVAVSGQTILTSSQDFSPFVSRDAGKTWTSPSGPLAEGGGVAINPADPTHCYAFTSSNFALSVDGCQTFHGVNGPTWQNYVSASNQNLIAIDPHAPSNVYVGASDGIWLSNDWGSTFTHLSWPLTQVSQIVFDPLASGVIYVCSTGGFYQSMNGGTTWNKLPLPTSAAPYGAAVSPTDSNVILVALGDGAGRQKGGILRSTNRGLTFNFANQGLSTVNFNLGIDQQAIAFNPAPPSGTVPIVALATTGGVFASADLGTSWQNIGGNAIPHVFSDVHWDRGYLWASTYGQGVLRSDQPVSSTTFSSALKVTGGPIWFTSIVGLSDSGSQTLQVTTVGAARNFTVSTAQSSGSCGNWLSANPPAGTTIGTATGFPVTVSYTVAALPANTSATCSGSVTVTGAGGTVIIPVTIQIMQLSQSAVQEWRLAFTQSSLGVSSMNMVFDSRRQVTVMFGGRNWPANTAAYSNTYQYAPTGWNQISTPHSPPRRFGSAMAYDDHRQRTVLFGGQTNSSTFGDTWEFDGADWTAISTVHGPSPQSGISMTYDSCRQRTVLFDHQGKTWEYDGADWTSVTTAASPPGRNLAAMVFDPGQCRALLFGGGPISGSSNALSDTWSYDGANWTQINPTTAPPGRWAHAMAFDTSRGRIVLFGGYGPAYPAGTDTSDTWEFDGSTWIQVFPHRSPGSTEQAAMVYDQSRSRIVMFGGWGAPTQAWEYTPGPVWSVAASHAGPFSRGQSATFTVNVANTVWTDQTSGTVTVRETMPPGLALVSMSGTGWTCTPGSAACTRADALAIGASYPPITVVVNVAADAPPWVTNSVTVTGGGLAPATATDLTTITTGPPSLRFVPIQPCRISDTRLGPGPLGGPRMNGGEVRSIQVPQSPCGVPQGAAAYVLNVTVVPAGQLSYLTLWPTGQSQPVVSTLNSLDGRIKANAAIVPAGNVGAVSVFVTNPSDVILDVSGYFVSSTVASSLAFYPLTPCRIADTRLPQGAFGGPSLVGGQSRTFAPPISACALPAGAQAYSLNFTVVPHGPLGYLTTWPAGQAQPFVSTLNAPTGTVVANAAIVPAGSPNGGISVYATDTTDLIIDVNGYFAAPAPAGLSFYTLSPCRVADTRNATAALGGPVMSPGQTRPLPVPASACAAPAAPAYSLNATVVPAGMLGYLSLWPAGGSQPLVSTLNSLDGSIVANGAIVPASSTGAISAYVTDQTHLILDINGYFAP
jgi:hypothetical protein